MLTSLILAASLFSLNPAVGPMHSSNSYTLNSGQWSAEVVAQFATRSLTVWITRDGATFEIRSGPRRGNVVRLQFEAAKGGSDPIQVQSPLPSRVTFIQGSKEPSRAPAVGGLVIPDIWAGVDCRWLVVDGQPRFDLLVAPSADPRDLRLQLHGGLGLQTTSTSLKLITDSGELTIGDLRSFTDQPNPRPIESSFEQTSPTQVKINIPPFRKEAIVVDPTVYSTLLGGSLGDSPWAVRLASNNDVYVLGMTDSSDFPTLVGAYDRSFAGLADIFIARLDPTLTSLVWATYLGGSGDDYLHGNSVATDLMTILDDDSVLFACSTTSSDFPTTNGVYLDAHAGGVDLAVGRLSADGSTLMFSTFLGGPGQEDPLSINATRNGDVLVTGWTTSAQFPTTPNAFSSTYQGGSSDGFVLKISGDGQELLTSTYLGGSTGDRAHDAIELVDGSESVVVVLESDSSNFPTTEGAYDRTYNGGSDVVIAVLDATLASLERSTYLGGNSSDKPYNVIANANGLVVSGYTLSSNFPTTPGVVQSSKSGAQDGFVTILSHDLQAIVASTFLGGSGHDQLLELVDAGGDKVLVGGFVVSGGLPTTPDAVSSSYAGLVDGYIALLSPDLTSVLYGSYFGVSGNDGLHGLAVQDGFIVASGDTTSASFPVASGAFQSVRRGHADAYIYRIEVAALSSVALTGLSVAPRVVYGPGTVVGTVNLNGPAPVGGVLVELSLTFSPAIAGGIAPATIPTSVVIPGGQTTATFEVEMAAVGSRQRVNVRASALGVTLEQDCYINPPFVSSLAINPVVVPGGTTTTGTVTLNSEAPAGGMSVAVSSNSGLASVPATVVVPEGSTTATFDIETGVVVSGQSSALITATAGGASKSRAVYVNQPYLNALTFAPVITVSSNGTTGTVTLTGPAPLGGLVVALASDHSNVIVPEAVMVNEGEASALFTVQTVADVAPQVKGLVTATLGLVVKKAAVYVNRPYLQSLSLSPSIVYGGMSSTGTVTLNAPAPPGGMTINLSDNSGNATTPASVTVPEGETSATFEVTTVPILGAQQTVVVTATADGVSRNRPLYINQPFVTGLSFSPEVIVGGNSTTGTVTLNAPAPTGGFTVSLSSDSGSATVPASVVVPAGETSVTFFLDSTVVVGPQVKALISAAGGGATKRKYVYLNPSG